MVKDQRKIIHSLELSEPLGVRLEDHQGLKNYRFICDTETYEKLLTHKGFSSEIDLYWKNCSEFENVHEMRISKKFENFSLYDKKFDQDRIIFTRVSNKKKKNSLKTVINFHKQQFSKIVLKYYDKKLYKANLFDLEGGRTKIKLSKKPENKNSFKVEFNFNNDVEFLLPLYRANQVVGFVLKYSAEHGRQRMVCKERSGDILIPNSFHQILDSVKQLDLRIDISYFLPGNSQFLYSMEIIICLF